ncbi:uncharacterized protein MKK02DRAFT_40666 [Dioszegia hungarica]|uniref:Uncharacterized protein n=1 Tax=Dioszegia hungarica TaxID=4972 RepID=A0AA38H4G9_9TREE|nr:uncharacterized protein MKK02DRAFT_40666 [Dioszegia hungarica]KAI9632364.1 hypothetical protein MKK02DRAFT_40666 [Dioszegia hungarica]
MIQPLTHRASPVALWILIRHASTSASPAAPAPRRRRRQVEAKAGDDLIAPPDSISNIRPVIYASSPSSRHQTANSPYSTGEFPNASAPSRLGELELEWRLRRERVDAMNHRFWADRNQEFNAQLALRLSLLPTPASPPTPEDIKRREDVLSQFYADWQASNRDRMGVWVRRWWREVWEGLRMQGKVHWTRMLGR